MTFFSPLMFLTACALLAAPALAQNLNFAAAGSKDPVTITAEDGIEWHRKDAKIIAIGKTKTTRGTVILTAETLSALYQENQGTTEITQIHATDNVRITAPGEKAEGDKASYDLKEKVIILHGAPAKLITESGVVSADDALEYWQGKQMAVARGNATITKDDKKVKAPLITAYLTKKGTGRKTGVEKMFAYNGVVMTTKTEKISGDKAVYLPQKGTISLLGNVTIRQGDNVLQGAYADVDLKTGISRLMTTPPEGIKGEKNVPKKRVQGIFIPESGESNKKQD